MALTAEERAQLDALIPNFRASGELQYLAEKKLLPQQQKDMHSFENPPLLTKLRRELFGMTGAESALVKRQEEALIPYQQEQKIKAELAPLLTTPLTELLGSSVGQGIRPTPEQIGPTRSGSMTVPQELVPSTFDIDALTARQPAGMTPSNIAFGRPGSVVSRPTSEPVMPPTREIDTYSQGILPEAKPTTLQALQASAQLHPSVMAAMVRTDSPPHPMAVSPGSTVIDPSTGREIYKAPMSPQQEKINNLVDQSVGIESKGKYRTLQDALDAGDTALAQRAFNRAKLEIPVTVAAATGLNAQQIALNKPLSPVERSNVFSRSDFIKTGKLTLAPSGVTAGQAARGDYINVSDKDLDQITALGPAAENFRAIFDIADKIIVAKTPLDAVLQGPLLQAKAISKTGGGDATLYETTKNALANNLAKAFGGERGVLTNVDVKRWVDALPTFYDTEEVKNKKKAIFTRIYNAAEQAQRLSIVGDVPKAEARQLRKLLNDVETLHEQSQPVPTTKSVPNALAPFHDPKEEEQYQQFKREHSWQNR